MRSVLNIPAAVGSAPLPVAGAGVAAADASRPGTPAAPAVHAAGPRVQGLSFADPSAHVFDHWRCAYPGYDVDGGTPDGELGSNLRSAEMAELFLAPDGAIRTANPFRD